MARNSIAKKFLCFQYPRGTVPGQQFVISLACPTMIMKTLQVNILITPFS
jgi:hypothetical protein